MRRLHIGRGLVVFVVVEEVVEEEVVVVKLAVVVVRKIIAAKIAGVGESEEPVRKAAKICCSGRRILHEMAEIIVIKCIREAVAVQGRAASD